MTDRSATPIVHTQPARPAPAQRVSRTRLLLEGPIVSTLLRLAAPNVVVNVVLIAVTATVDAYFVAKLGPDALTGLALVFPLIMLMQQMANSSMGGAVASSVARAIGAGRDGEAAAFIVHGVVIAVGMAAVFAAVLLLGGPAIYALMGGFGGAHAAALEYSNAIFAGALAYWLLSTLTSVVRGAGQAAVLAVVYLAAEALHILLVPLFMFGAGPLPPLGITGAGLATVTSFTASSAVLAWYVATGRTAIRVSLGSVRLEKRLFVDILRVGAPMSLQPILNNLAPSDAHGVRRRVGGRAARWVWCRRTSRVPALSVSVQSGRWGACDGRNQYRSRPFCAGRAYRMDRSRPRRGRHRMRGIVHHSMAGRLDRSVH
jgi:Na+-driven multidrug efflux pump